MRLKNPRLNDKTPLWAVKLDLNVLKTIRSYSESDSLVKILFYYMAVSHKDWELANSRIWLAGIGIESGLYFPV